MTVDVSKLIDEGYDFSLINQIQKAQEKGYNLTNLSPCMDASLLRKTISEMPNVTKKIKGIEYEIILKSYGVKDKLRKVSLDKEEQSIMITAIKDGINPKVYTMLGYPGFSTRSITEIANQGKSLDIDIVDYLNKGYGLVQIHEILKAIENNFNIEKFITPDDSMDTIIGMNKLNDFYCSKGIKKDKLFCDICKMKLKRRYIDEIIKCLELRKNINIIFSDLITKEQIGPLLTAIKKDYPLTTMINKKFSCEQLNAILNGLDLGVDTSLYSNPDYLTTQMNSILKVLIWNKKNPERILDVTPILNPKISGFLMEQYLNCHKFNDEKRFANVLEQCKQINKRTGLER